MKEDYLARGFQKIHDDLAFLMNCFREVLEELGENHLAANLPWISPVQIDLPPNPRLCQAYSIAFQLLNMVEENVAAQVRRSRESETGLAGNRDCGLIICINSMNPGFRSRPWRGN